MAYVKRLVKGSALTAAEHDGNIDETIALLSAKVGTGDSRLTDARTPTAHTQAISTVTGLQDALDAKAATTYIDGLLDDKLDADDPSTTNARPIEDGDYDAFTVASGDAAIVSASATQVYAGTAGKAVGADRLYGLQQPTTVVPSAGTLTLNWTAANIPTLHAFVSVTANITTISISNLPLNLTCTLRLEITGAYTISVPAHGATVDGKTFYRVDDEVWPSFPTGDGAVVILCFRATSTRIYCAVGGLCSAPA